MSARLQTAVLGATGYSGQELTRLLLRHPRVESPVLLARDGVERSDMATSSPGFSGNGDHPLLPFDWDELSRRKVKVLFLATPHEISRSLVPQAIARGLRVIDLSGAWRLKQARHRAIYGFEDHDTLSASELTARAVYGLPELHASSIADAALVANPGCYATSIILGLAPLLRAGVVDEARGIIADSKSGASGAGKEPNARTHFVSVADNLSVYSVFNHRHLGEIAEQLNLESENITFTPHLLPITRGILSTIYVRLNREMTAREVETSLRSFYANKPWVRIFESSKLPEIRFSLHTNYCDIGFCVDADRHRLVLVSCLDNLLKGAAGQAVQNMNLMCGWSEKEGLN